MKTTNSHILEEVASQIIQYGSYFPGKTPQERMLQMKRRAKELRAEIKAEKLAAAVNSTIPRLF